MNKGKGVVRYSDIIIANKNNLFDATWPTDHIGISIGHMVMLESFKSFKQHHY